MSNPTTISQADEAYLAGKSYAEGHAPYFRESPLSGEWAGESISEIAYAYGLDPEGDWMDDFEEGYLDFASAS